MSNSLVHQSPRPSKRESTDRTAFDNSQKDDAIGKSMAPPVFQLKADEGGDDKKKEEQKTNFNWSGAVLGGAIGGLGGGISGMFMGGISGGLYAGGIENLLTVGSKKAESFDDLKVILQTIPTGKESLQRFKDYGTTIEFVAGGGSYHSAGKMTIDANETVREAALTFVHEMNHAYYEKAGLRKDIMKDNKKDYVAGMVEEEAEGTVKSIEAKIELEGTIIDTKGLSFPLETEYRTAYKTAYDAGIKAGSMAEEAKQCARSAGKDAVVKGFLDGKVQTSNTGESYSAYYGDAWDKNHPAGK